MFSAGHRVAHDFAAPRASKRVPALVWLIGGINSLPVPATQSFFAAANLDEKFLSAGTLTLDGDDTHAASLSTTAAICSPRSWPSLSVNSGSAT